MESGGIRIYPFSGGWGISTVFFGFRLGDMIDIRVLGTVRK